MQSPYSLRRQQRRRGSVRNIMLVLGLSFIMSSAWLLAQKTNPPETIIAGNYKTYATDGDSFTIGNRKLRLKGIDAPELHQTCSDAKGLIWACGEASHQAMISLLAEHGLSCVTDVSDRYGRALATCKSSKTIDIGAAQVKAGMAASDNFHAMRTYGAEEDVARSSKVGIWRGSFIDPKEWRAAHPRNAPPRSAPPQN
jgi:endonuclease YncB( thermonuclease family)